MLFRSIPLILTLFWAFFLLPRVLRAVTGDPHAQVGPIFAAIIGLVLAEAAYHGEMIRGGILGVALGLGLLAQTLILYIIIIVTLFV